MISNATIQPEIINFLKNTGISGTIVPMTEVREDTWQGTTFSYPSVRLQLLTNQPDISCMNKHAITFIVHVFSEQASSLQADTIAGQIAANIHRVQTNFITLRFMTWVTNVAPAIRTEVNVWRSGVEVSAIVSPGG